MENLIIIAVLICIIGGALAYICKAKKEGQKCIGCPNSKACGKCSCCSEEE